MVQTPDGYIWFGTFDGLVRFDGVRFKVFGQQPTTGLPFNRIVGLRVDKAGRLRIKPTQNDLIAVLEKGVFRTLGNADGLMPGPGFSFTEADNGDPLLARDNSAVFRFNGKRFVAAPELGRRSACGLLPGIAAGQLSFPRHCL